MEPAQRPEQSTSANVALLTQRESDELRQLRALATRWRGLRRQGDLRGALTRRPAQVVNDITEHAVDGPTWPVARADVCGMGSAGGEWRHPLVSSQVTNNQM